jgi:myo-inositol-1(or 4)-monophosphatase
MRFLNTAKKAAKRAGKIIKKNYGHIKKLDHKESVQDIVTNVDIESERVILRTIKKFFPEHSILSEESGEEKKKSEYEWIIDPLDGTTNFSIQNPFFCTALGLLYKKEIVLGVVYNPIMDEMFSAEKGKGARLNGKKIRVSGNRKLSNTVVNFCHGNTGNDVKRMSALFLDFKKSARDFRRLGSANMDMSYVAVGRNDVFIASGIPLWDVTAGYIIAKEAGAKITDWQNNTWSFKSKTLLVTNGKVHKEVLKILRKKGFT